MTKKNRKKLSKNNKKSAFYDKYTENKQKKGNYKENFAKHKPPNRMV